MTDISNSTMQLDAARLRYDHAGRAWKQAQQSGNPDPDSTECDAASDALWSAEVAEIEATLRMDVIGPREIERYLTIACRHMELEIDVRPDLLRLAQRLRT